MAEEPMTLRCEKATPGKHNEAGKLGARGGWRMTWWQWGVIVFLIAWVAGCGGNSTAVGIVLSPATASVILSGPVPFSATATGGNVTTVFWQICLLPTTGGNQPTSCTQGIGPGTGCTIPTIAKPLIGYGTITGTGLYTAPPSIPQTNPFLVVATSCVQANAFATAIVTVLSGVRVQITPTTATVGTQERFTFTATVTGSTDQSVTWAVNGNAGGDSTDGFICPNPLVPTPPACPPGTYVAPFPAPNGSVTIKATSGADPSQSASATVTVLTAAIPILTSIDPTSAAQGSVQQDLFLSGSNFFSTSTVLVNGVPIPTTFLQTGSLRATLPAALLQQVQVLNVQVKSQEGNLSGTSTLNVVPVRPAVISSSPDSVTQVAPNAIVNITGGFYSLGTTVGTFNGLGGAQGVTTTFVDTRNISIGLPTGAIAIPGLYPITVQNLDAALAHLPSTASVNLAVEPSAANIPTAPSATIGVGAKPSAVAIDPILNLAVVTNRGSNSVTLIDLGSNTVAATINNVGSQPTSVAIDDLLPPPHQHVALVVNSGDNTVAAIDLATQQVLATVSVAIGPAGTSPVAFSVGVNPLSHHAVVAYQSTNIATILDLVPPNPQVNPPCTTPPCILSTIGGSLTPFSTGASPAIAVDPRVNWALITPGGGGTTNIVDLGRDTIPNPNPLLPPIDPGTLPRVVGSLSITTTIQGVALNTETHQALLTDVNGTTLSTFSLLDNSVNTITFPVGELGYVASGVNSLDNIGVAVNGASNKAVVVDLESGNVLQTVALGAGSSPQAVAVAQELNEAVIANAGSGNVSILRLGTGFRPLQITQASPAIAFAPASAPLALTIEGFGFVQGTSQVLLDGVALQGTPAVSNGGREITATVPANQLGTARNYAVQVQNAGAPATVSNVIDLMVVQGVTVGNQPFGVAVDTDNDVAVVTNSANNTVSLVDLTTGNVIIPVNAESLTTGTTPQGVAIISRMGQAVVANNGTNDFTIIDVTGNNNSITKALCTGCAGATGVGINQDTGTAAITSSLTNQVSFINLFDDTVGASPTVDQNPTAVAIDPNPTTTTTDPLVAVATSSQTSSLDILDQLTGGLVARINGLQNPTGVLFDPVNQDFLVANSLQNTVVIVDPNAFQGNSVRVSINPTSIDYNFQASTLITANHVSSTLSVMEYVCPAPLSGGPSNCAAARTRLILGFASSPQFSVAVDPKMNLAVLADEANDRVWLIPMPH
jgi:YVTN family beta-propeller protein